GGRDRGGRRVAYLGPTTPPSPPSPLCPPCRGPDARRDPVAPVSAALLPPRPRPLAALPTPLPRRPGAPLRAGPALLAGVLSGPRGARALAPVPRRYARSGVGRLRARAPPRS